jgi:hypothetical protein
MIEKMMIAIKQRLNNVSASSMRDDRTQVTPTLTEGRKAPTSSPTTPTTSKSSPMLGQEGKHPHGNGSQIQRRAIISPRASAEYVPFQATQHSNKYKSAIEQWMTCPCDEQSQFSSSLEKFLDVQHFDNFQSLYVVRRPLRSGSYGSVCEVEHRLSKQLFAVKTSDRT